MLPHTRLTLLAAVLPLLASKSATAEEPKSPSPAPQSLHLTISDVVVLRPGIPFPKLVSGVITGDRAGTYTERLKTKLFPLGTVGQVTFDFGPDKVFATGRSVITGSTIHPLRGVMLSVQSCGVITGGTGEYAGASGMFVSSSTVPMLTFDFTTQVHVMIGDHPSVAQCAYAPSPCGHEGSSGGVRNCLGRLLRAPISVIRHRPRLLPLRLRRSTSNCSGSGLRLFRSR